jgi:ribonuclease D
MSLITSTDELAAFCRRVAASDYVTVDTEFMRERTYWPILCLAQVAGPDEAAAIDPLADGIDLAPLFELMADGGVLKVFHAARQDLEIFYHLTGRLPAPVFDTQIAAMVCGFGDQVGYETLVATLTRGHLDKASRFTDWSHRPLSQRQIDYALGDVTHLRKVYEKLRARLAANGRVAWLDEEMTTLTPPPMPTTRCRRSAASSAGAARAFSPSCASSPPGASVRPRTATCCAAASCATRR